MNYHLKPMVLGMMAITCFSSAGYTQTRFNHYRSYQDSKALGFGKLLQRTSLGYSMHFARATLTQRYCNELDPPYKHWQGPKVDTTDVRLIKTNTQSWGAVGGVYFPLAKLSDKSTLALNVDMAINFLVMPVGKTKFTEEVWINDDKAVGLMVGLPLSIDFKTGGDAVLDKTQKTMLTLGFGVNPSLFGVDYEFSGADERSLFKALPFIKAEVGFFAGIAFKLRGTAYLGRAIYFDATETNRIEDESRIFKDYDETSIKLAGKNYGYNIALLIMPYSWDWGSED